MGYNLQFPNSQFVVGLEGSVDGSSLSKTVSGSPFIAGVFVPITIQTKSNIEGSIRGRLGWALGGLGWDRALIYATGGVAFAGVEGSISTPFGFDSASNTRVGFTVGGGLEYAWTNNWVIGVEYRFSQFSRSTFFADTAFRNVGAFVDRNVDENQVQARLSYKFDTVLLRPRQIGKTRAFAFRLSGERPGGEKRAGSGSPTSATGLLLAFNVRRAQGRNWPGADINDVTSWITAVGLAVQRRIILGLVELRHPLIDLQLSLPGGR